MTHEDQTNWVFGKALLDFTDLFADAPRKLIAARELFVSYFNAANEHDARIALANYYAMEDACIEHRMGLK